MDKVKHIVHSSFLHETLSEKERSLHSQFDDLIPPPTTDFNRDVFCHFVTSVNVLDARTLLHPVQNGKT